MPKADILNTCYKLNRWLIEYHSNLNSRNCKCCWLLSAWHWQFLWQRAWTLTAVAEAIFVTFARYKHHNKQFCLRVKGEFVFCLWRRKLTRALRLTYRNCSVTYRAASQRVATAVMMSACRHSHSWFLLWHLSCWDCLSAGNSLLLQFLWMW